jgi:uncharacterized protein YggE
MKRGLWIVALISGTALGQAAAPGVPPARTISVAGEAVEYVTPDEAVVRFGIETFDKNLAAATSASDAKNTELVQALRGAGIEEKDISADHADLEIVYERDGIAQGVAGYRMRRAYAVTLRTVRRLDAIVRLALKSGANHLDGYELQTSQLRKYRDDVRKRAIAAAREKAQALAGELGCTVGPPVSINEGYYGWFGTRGSWTSGGMNAMAQNVRFDAGAGSGSGESSATPIGQIGVRAQVNVVFDLVVASR